jgi:hypothetical protein
MAMALARVGCTEGMEPCLSSVAHQIRETLTTPSKGRSKSHCPEALHVRARRVPEFRVLGQGFAQQWPLPSRTVRRPYTCARVASWILGLLPPPPSLCPHASLHVLALMRGRWRNPHKPQKLSQCAGDLGHVLEGALTLQTEF